MSVFLEFQGLSYFPTQSISLSYRDRLRQRGRNRQSYRGSQTSAPILPFGFLVQKSLKIGLGAFNQTLIPAFVVQILIGSLVCCYFLFPQSHPYFEKISEFKKNGGWIASFLLMGGFVGLLSELISVFTTTKKWTPNNTTNFGYNFIVFGLIGVFTDFFYAFQSKIVGSETNFSTIATKMLIDQFIWTPFFVSPYQVLLGRWKALRFNFRPLLLELRRPLQWFGKVQLPVLLSNWGFWIPMCTLIYCFPTSIQFPIAILAVSLWLILLNAIMKIDKK